MPALQVLLGGSGFQMAENLPALPQRQLQITEVPLSRAGLEGREQVLEGVFFVLEILCEVFETARRKKCSQAFWRMVTCDPSRIPTSAPTT